MYICRVIIYVKMDYKRRYSFSLFFSPQSSRTDQATVLTCWHSLPLSFPLGKGCTRKVLDKRRGGSFIGHGGEREVKRKNENNEETGRGVIEKRERASTLFQAPTSVFSLSCLRSLRVLAFLPLPFTPFSCLPRSRSALVVFRRRGWRDSRMVCRRDKLLNAIGKKRKARVGGEVYEVTRALETGTG